MGINSFNTAALVITSNKTRSMQDGTPKFLASGVARACYAMLSTGTGGIAYYDKYFQQIVPEKNSAASTGGSTGGNYQNSPAGDLIRSNWLFGDAPTSATAPASSTTPSWLNATVSAGEFGNTMVDCFSNSTAVPVYSRSNDQQTKSLLNQMFVDSDHSDRSLVYIQQGASISAVPRIDGVHNYSQRNSASFNISLTSGNINGAMVGSSSYNAIRKEFVCLGYSSPGVFALISYTGVDFDKFPSPAVAFSQPGVVKIEKSVTLPSWIASGSESIYNLKPTLCDNGDIFITVMFPSSSFVIYRVIRDASNNPTAAVSVSKALTTSYGLDQGAWYGQRKIQARDGGAVLCFCAYYYYGSGVTTYIVDKRKSTIVETSLFDSASSSSGVMPIPYGDDGFSAYFAGNVYAGNPTGAYIQGTKERNGSGVLSNTSGTFYLPYFPIPNTTNYPGFTQVVDYSLLNNQSLI